MNCSQLDAFLAVVKKGSITAAAKELHLTQPALSAQISTLESLLGVKLFERSKKGVVLTSEGQTFLFYAKKMYKLHCNLQHEIKASK